jgi:hypothetical protein
VATIGAISGPSEALPSSEALEIPEALKRRRGAPGGKGLSATLLSVLPVPGSPEILTAGKIYVFITGLRGHNNHQNLEIAL